MNAFLIELRNKPGELARIAEAIASKGINITAVSGSTCGDGGSVAVVTADESATRMVLNDAGAANDHFRFMQELRPSRCRRRSRSIPSAANALSRAEFQRRHRKGRPMS